MSNMLRITGMATGMDTDTTVKQLIKPLQMRIDKLKQDKQLVQWRQDMFREAISDINSMKSTFFDVLKADSYVLSTNSYAGFDVKVFDAGTATASSGINITPGTNALTGNYKVDFTGGNLARGAGVASSAGINGAKPTTKLSDLGITTTSISINYTNKLGVFDSADITIDPSTMSLSDLAKKIGTETSSNVVARFSELTGKFTVDTLNTGGDMSLGINDNDGGNLLEKLNMADLGATSIDSLDLTYGVEPKDLLVTITSPGGTPTTVTKSTNNFTIDGVNYNFTSAAKNADITIGQNVQKTFDKIKGFIDKYNELVEKLNTKIDEKRQYSYRPLTEDQKKAMGEDEVKAWEEKAKGGLLKNDSMIEGMLSSMRNAFYDQVKDAGITISEMGLSTSSDYTKRGKIIVDESKLKVAIQRDGDKVANVFAKTSSSKPLYDPDYSNIDRKTRNSEQGIFQRINDILNDYTRTSRDNSGKKGYFIEKAGIKGDFTDFNNLLTKDINAKEDYINIQIKKMSAKEDQYYNQFAKLESAMNQMNSQSSWMAQQFGGGK